MSMPRFERGNTLLMGLILLVLLTLMAISAMQSSTTDMQITGNSQFEKEAAAAAQQAIEQVISTSGFTTAPPLPVTVDMNQDGTADYTVTFTPAPQCMTYTAVDLTQPGLPVICYGSIGNVCYWTMWDVVAVVSDPDSKASVTIHQGVRTLAGLNAALASCLPGSST